MSYVWSDSFALAQAQFKFVPITLNRRQQMLMRVSASRWVEVFWLDAYNFGRFTANQSFKHEFKEIASTEGKSWMWTSPSVGAWYFVVRNLTAGIAEVIVHLETP